MNDLKAIHGVILDLDGVVWRDMEALPAVPEFFHFLNSKGIRYLFATNNSGQTPEAYLKKITGMGIPCSVEQILSSAIATANYLHEHYFPQAKKVFVVGGNGIVESLQQAGFEITEDQADLLVVGIDRQLTYEKLRRAVYQLQGGAVFIGTNGDKSYPEPTGYAPGAGSIIAAIEAATGVTPIIVGKPERPMFGQALRRLDTSIETTLMIGDRLETDILGANRLGIATVLVLTGISQPKDIEMLGIQPTWVVENLFKLMEKWPSAH
jgi:4-nitrophenyl phosphatase